jgi:dienelactone hydrolase
LPTLDRLRGRVAEPEAVPAAGRFPVLLSLPGWGGRPEDTTALAQELASHGFVVAGVAMPDPIPPMDFSTDAAFAATLALADRTVRSQAANASLALDRLARLDAHDPDGRFTGRLDTGRTGIFGFSLGGAVAVQAAWQDPRFRAVMNLDGWLFGDAAAPGDRRFPDAPVLDVNDGAALPGQADLTAADPERRNPALLTARDAGTREALLAASGGYQMTIAGSRHPQFADTLLLSPLARLRAGDAIATSRVALIVGRYALAFFDETLNGHPAPLLAARPPNLPFPEVAIRVFTARPGP